MSKASTCPCRWMYCNSKTIRGNSIDCPRSVRPSRGSRHTARYRKSTSLHQIQFKLNTMNIFLMISKISISGSNL